MARSKGGLGKGLNAIISDATIESGSSKRNEELDIDQIFPNPNQPRKDFNESDLEELTDSIKQEGLLQPILVRPQKDGYQIIAGERRWQACKNAGLKSVPVRILEMDDIQTMRVALVENLQRTDLNAIEEARGFKELMRVGSLTQAQLAKAVSKSRSAVANSLRLLDLPEEVQNLIYEGEINAGHARAILSVSEKDKRIKLGERVAKEHLSVRETENIARLMSLNEQEKTEKEPTPQSFRKAARKLRSMLKTKVAVRTVRGKNKIEIEFADEDELDRILEILE